MKTLSIAIITLALTAPTAAFAQATQMDGMAMGQSGKETKAAVHQATGVVKNVDAGNGKVTLEHGPVKTLNWPAMTMTFGVKDKGLLDKLRAGQRVQVEFQEQGGSYVITSVK
ncbi:copper-binding protein [Massilia sp. LXY-6]|uniref:copper-binding protein n=1 Tax=Massilia sp. LXY-6 TaxID=3379823 RepID=UPI003EDEFA13